MTNPSQNSPSEHFLTARQVRERYGNASAMWLFRRERNDPSFPRPIIISGRKLWSLTALETWERSLATKSNQASHLTNRNKEQDKNEAAASR